MNPEAGSGSIGWHQIALKMKKKNLMYNAYITSSISLLSYRMKTTGEKNNQHPNK